MIEAYFSFADDLGPLKLVHIHRSSIGLTAVVAIDNVACGPSLAIERVHRAMRTRRWDAPPGQIARTKMRYVHNPPRLI